MACEGETWPSMSFSDEDDAAAEERGVDVLPRPDDDDVFGDAAAAFAIFAAA